MGFWPFKRSAGNAQAQALLAVVIEASRQPTLYGEGAVPDTLEGRFELMTLHGALALIRLRSEPNAGALAQDFADKLFRHFDSGLREAGVGDLTVPKRMRRLAGDFYGRLEAYAAALATQDPAAVERALARNLLAGAPGANAAPMAQYALATAARLASTPLEALTTRQGWGLTS